MVPLFLGPSRASHPSTFSSAHCAAKNFGKAAHNLAVLMEEHSPADACALFRIAAAKVARAVLGICAEGSAPFFVLLVLAEAQN